MKTPYRLFLSSPRDVADERKIADRVVQRLNAETGGPLIDIVLWEDHFYTADSTFQDQIAKPSECDIVVCIFWKRLGSELPDAYQRPDGTIPTGSEFEFEDALHHAAESHPKTPDVLVYRKTAPVTFQEDTLALEKAQRDSFLSFWKRWFYSEQGHFVAGFQSFETADDFEGLIEKHLRGWIKSRQPRSQSFRGSPFRGLDFYTIDDVDCFFGRDREIQRARARFLVNASSGHPVLFLTGTSGSGKSSLIRAGVLAHFKKPGTLSAIADDACIVIETPTSLAKSGDWAQGLAAAFLAAEPVASELADSDFGSVSALAELLRSSPASAASVLFSALNRVSASKGSGHRTALLIAIDQLEEAFNFPPNETVAFAKCLLELSAPLDKNEPRIGLIFGMRSDYRHLLAGNPEFATLAGFTDVKGPDETERLLEIAQPQPADLRDIILGPARLADITYETDPTSGRSLALEIEEQASQNSLPALQLLLTELYKHRQDNLLTLTAFDTLGGLGGVVAKVAETEFEDMPSTVQASLPRVLRAMSVQDPDNSKTLARRLASDTFAQETPEHALVTRLSDARLILNDGETMRIAHESLLDAWPRASEILDQNRRFSQLRDRLGRRALALDAASKSDAKQMRLTGFDLNEGRELLRRWGPSELSDTYPTLPAFLQASIRAARKKTIGTILGVVSVGAVLLGVGATAWLFNIRAGEATKRAQVSFQLARSGVDLMAGDEVSAISAALQAVGLEDTVDTRSALVEALSALSPFYHATLNLPNRLILWRDSQHIQLFGSSRVETLDAQSLQRTARTSIDREAPLIAAIPTADEGWFGIGANADVIDHTGQSVHFNKDEVDLVRASQADIVQIENGPRMVAFADEFAGAWASRCNVAVALQCETAAVMFGETTAVSWSGDGSKLVVAYVDENNVPSAAVFLSSELFAGQAMPNVVARGDRGDVWLSAIWLEGDDIVLASRSGNLTIVALAADPKTISFGGTPITALDWSSSGPMLAVSCDSLNICLLSRDGEQIAKLHGHSQVITDVAFSPDGTKLVSAGDQDETIIWILTQNEDFMSVLQGGQDVQTTAFTARDGQWAYGDATGTVYKGASQMGALFTLRSGRPIEFLAYGQTGALAVSDRNGGLAIWLSTQTKAEPDIWLPDQDAQQLAWLANGDLAFTTRAGDVGTFRLSDGSNTVAITSLEQRADGITSLGLNSFATSHIGGRIYIWPANAPKDAQLLNGDWLKPQDLSAFSLSASPSGEWLAATRGDDQIIVYNVNAPEKSASADILRRNSKASLFSPSATRLAALDADGMLYVWDFETATGELTLKFVLRALNQHFDLDGGQKPVGVGWLNDHNLAVSIDDGSIYRLDVRSVHHKVRARSVAQKVDTLAPDF